MDRVGKDFLLFIDVFLAGLNLGFGDQPGNV